MVGQFHTVTIGVLDDVGQRQQAGNILGGLPRQVERPEVAVLASATTLLDGFLDPPFARVVGRDGVEPVAIEVVAELLQVVHGRCG